MGTVTFDTDVLKTVDITKTVNLTVDKTVESTVDLDGSLATAEASADALSAGQIRRTLFDNFEYDELIEQTGVGTASDMVVLGPDNFEPLANEARSNVNQIIITAGTSSGSTETNIGTPPNVLGRFSSDVGAAADFVASYFGDTNGDGVFGDAFPVLLSGEDPSNASLIFTDVTSDPGVLPSGDPASSTPVEISYEDSDGDVAVVRFSLPAVTDQDISINLGEFTGAVADSTPGEPNSPNPDLDFDSIVRFEFSVLAGSELGASGLEITANDIFIEVVEPGAGDVLAEVDTFAQVSELGAFAFAESLAALSVAETDTLVF